jgi:hypothetical protein
MQTGINGHAACEEFSDCTFSEWLIALSEDCLQCVNGGYVQCPPNMIIKCVPFPTNGQQDNGRACFIDHVYPGICGGNQIARREFLAECAILALHNHEVMEINEEILKLILDNERTYLSANSISDPASADFIPVEYLNRLDPNGWPHHQLSHKVGTLMMLLRNLDHINGLCNGTRLLIRRFAQHVIEAEVMIGDHKGHIAFVLCRPLTSKDAILPYEVKCKQFPVRLAYVMTINKSQGQTLKHVDIDVNREVFSHGQLYVAFSHATLPAHVNILLADDVYGNNGRTYNVVYI